MDFGTGIFCSVIFLAFAALLFYTKEKWTFKKLFLYPSLIILALLGLSGASYYGYNEGYYGPNKIGKEMEYGGVRLGWTKSDLLFAKGTPNSVTEIDENGLIYWNYKSYKSNLAVAFGQDGMVRSIASNFDSEDISDNLYIERLKCIDGRSDLEKIDRILGKPEFIQYLDEGRFRLYRYPSNNISILLTEKKIIGIRIRDFKRYPFGFYKDEIKPK